MALSVMACSVWVARRIPPKARPLRIGGWIEAAVAQGGPWEGVREDSPPDGAVTDARAQTARSARGRQKP